MPSGAEGLDVRVSFDPDHEDMVAEIYFGGRCFALLSQDEGDGQLAIEIYPLPENGTWKLPLAEVEAAVAHAKKRPGELRPASRSVYAAG